MPDSDPLTLVRRTVMAGLGEVNLLRLLPAVSATLGQIRDAVQVIAREVTEMNGSVGRIEPEVAEVAGRLEGLEQRTSEIEASMRRLHEQMDRLDETLHPLRRRGRRAGDGPGAGRGAPG